MSRNDVTGPRHLRTFIAFLSDASAAVQAATLDVAQHKIQRAIIRTDGWSLRGRPDARWPGKDWILAKDPAMKLYTLLKDSLAALKRAQNVDGRSKATMRGVGSAPVSLCTDSRYQ